MTTYTDVFGSATVPPSEYGYQSLSITSNTTLVWPYNSTGGTSVSKIIELTATAGLSLTLPDATQVSTGEDFLIKNVGAESVAVLDSAGGAVSTVTAGSAVYFYLKSNATAAGTWGTVAYGVGTSSVDAATLVGYGLMAASTTLNTAHPVAASASGVTIDATYRAKVFVFTGGADNLALTAAATLGDNFYCLVRNSGTGTLTINPDGGELIDGVSTLGLQPGESLILACSGAAWYSVGYGRSILYQFSQLVKDVSAAGTITLSASEASNKLLTFNGNPATDLNVVVPNTVAVYYVQSAISTAKTITLKTAAGTGVAITQSQQVISICDGTNVVNAQSLAATANLTYLDGSAAAPSANFASSTNSGFFLKGVNGVGISVNGAEVVAVESGGVSIAQPITVTGNAAATSFNSVALNTGAAGTDNLAIGANALDSAAAGASDNIAIGKNALTALTTTDRNVVIGNGAAAATVATLSDAVIIGHGAATAMLSGSSSVFIGKSVAGVATGGAGDSVVVGYEAGNVVDGATESTIIGYRAGYTLTNGGGNVILGTSAGNLMTTGFRNIAVGYNTRASTTGSYNIVIGALSGNSMSNATTNVVVGASANVNGTGSNTICIGYQAEPSVAGAANEITLGNSSITTLRCQVTSITALSDRRDKTDVATLPSGLSTVMALNPVRFTWNMRDGGKVGIKDAGFIAQDLQMVDDDWLKLVYADNPEKLEASYGRLIPVLVKAIQELNAKVEELTNAR